MTAPSLSRSSSRRLFLIAFWLFAASIGFSIAGTLLLVLVPAANQWFAPVMDGLIKTPTWTYMALLPVISLALYWRELGPWRSLGFLMAGSVIGATAELAGTNTGFPFGAYFYTDWLGPKIAGDVPYFIPPSWYALSILSLDLARRLGLNRLGRIVGVAFFMILWDVALDPAMNRAFPFWTYPGGGPFFGMPWQNWFGWAVTSLAIGAAYEYLLGGLQTKPDAFVARWAPRAYALNVFFPVAVCFLYGVPLAGVIGLVALAVPFVLLRLRGPQRPQPREVATV